VVTVSNLDAGSPTDNRSGDFSASGSLSGVSAADTLSFTVNGYSGTSVTGNNLVLTSATLQDVTRNSTNGWGVLNGGTSGEIGGNDSLTFAYDLSGLPANTGLRITGVTIGGSVDNGLDVQVLVDGISVAALGGGPTFSGLMIDITDGDLLAFREIGGSTSSYRVDTITLETFALPPVPEPTTGALLGIGGMMVLGAARRRRKRVIINQCS
jgi:hypothetical protein